MTTDTAVRHAITVAVSPEQAFSTFTAGFNSWWPRGHHIGEAELDAAVIEPREGGRWYERGVDGSECDWGKVLVWAPPRRLVLSWQLSSEWAYDADVWTEVEVTFSAEGPDRTRVELEHRGLDAYGDDMGKMRDSFDSPGGWRGLLEQYGAATVSG
ncbi:MAG TPA: SRPBCC family protein [Solirubrobacteraceae bacterium]|nr:SRPBCC family protein [Solirubrobacteraceae bacterium]